MMSKERLLAFTDAVLTLTIWPAAMMWAVLFTAVVIVIPRAI